MLVLALTTFFQPVNRTKALRKFLQRSKSNNRSANESDSIHCKAAFFLIAGKTSSALNNLSFQLHLTVSINNE
jgi:hypothetical protein